MKRVKSIINNCKDPKIAKEFRKLYATKIAQQYRANEADASVLSHTHGGVVDYETREHPRVGRGSKDSKEYKVRDYGDSPENSRHTEHPKFIDKIHEAPRSMSTRYSPDRPGIQARFVSDGVRQDPYTNKIYNWNEGFKTEDGDTIPPGGVGLQTDMYSNASLSNIAFFKNSQITYPEIDEMSTLDKAIFGLSPQFEKYFKPIVDRVGNNAKAVAGVIMDRFPDMEEKTALAYAVLAVDPLYGVNAPGRIKEGDEDSEVANDDYSDEEAFEDKESFDEWMVDKAIMRDAHFSSEKLSKIANLASSTHMNNRGYVVVDKSSGAIISNSYSSPKDAGRFCDFEKEKGRDCVICELREI